MGASGYPHPDMDSLSTTGSTFSLLQNATAAINRGVAGLSRDAATIASSSTDNVSDLLPALVDSRQQLLYTKAAARLMETADQMMGSLLDVQA